MRRWQTALSACRSCRRTLAACNAGQTPITNAQRHRIRPASSASRNAVLASAPAPSQLSETTIRPVSGRLLEVLSSAGDGESAAALLDTEEISTILHDADKHGKNGLHELAVTHGRWSDVVTIARRLLVGSQISPQLHSLRLYETVERTSKNFSLDQLTNDSIAHSRLAVRTEHRGPQFHSSLDELLDGEHRGKINGLAQGQHRMLGLVWSAIGTMTIACANDQAVNGGAIRPEILEILAMFHHHGLISPAVYSFKHNSAQDAVQQPIVLHLLSSHIIVALSDAEARARDLSAIAAAQAAGQDTRSMHFELRGTSMRATMEAVKPEVWLELILWSCLHGGWASAGLDILDSLCKQSPEHVWTAISWRSRLRELMPFDNAGATDWESLKFDLDTRRGSRADKAALPGLNTTRTISSEVVTAFVDIFTSHTDSSGFIRGVPTGKVVAWLTRIRQFLLRADVTLQNGSWSAIAQRLIDTSALSPESLDDVDSLLALTPGFGEEPNAIKTSDLPAYVFDGSAALLGFLHRALRAQISNANISGAERLSEVIEAITNEARISSVADFFESQQSQQRLPTDLLFISNFDGIDYPLFDPQIPPSTIASYIDLLVETRSFDKARNLFSADGNESFFLSRKLWTDPHVSGALLRLADATGDDALSQRLNAANSNNQGTLPRLDDTLISYFERGQWIEAAQLMLDMQQNHNLQWKVKCFAAAGRCLLLSPDPTANTVGWSVFEAMSTDIDTHNLGRMREENRSRSLYSIMCLLSLVDTRMAKLLARLDGPREFHGPSVAILNLVVDAVAQAQSNKAARELTSTFLAGQSKAKQASRTIPVTNAGGEKLVLRSRPVVSLMTVRLVVQHGLEEWQQTGSANSQDVLNPQELRQWAETLLGVVDPITISAPDIRNELDSMFGEHSMLSLKHSSAGQSLVRQ